MTKRFSEVKDFEPCCFTNFCKEDMDLVIRVSKALGNEARMEIYYFLSKNQACQTGQLVDYLPLAQSTISQHLKVLHHAGVLTGIIEGPHKCYCIDNKLMKRYHMLIGKMTNL